MNKFPRLPHTTELLFEVHHKELYDSLTQFGLKAFTTDTLMSLSCSPVDNEMAKVMDMEMWLPLEEFGSVHEFLFANSAETVRLVDAFFRNYRFMPKEAAEKITAEAINAPGKLKALLDGVRELADKELKKPEVQQDEEKVALIKGALEKADKLEQGLSLADIIKAAKDLLQDSEGSEEEKEQLSDKYEKNKRDALAKYLPEDLVKALDVVHDFDGTAADAITNPEVIEAIHIIQKNGGVFSVNKEDPDCFDLQLVIQA